MRKSDWIIIVFIALGWLVIVARGGNIDDCEIYCGLVFTQCLIDNRTSIETPNTKIERECKRWTESNCIRPCRRGK